MDYSQDNWERIITETLERVKWLGVVKNNEYAKEGDRLANFRDNAKSLGTRMELIWGVYAGKHWDAIRTYISDKVQGKERERSEPIESRVDDLITYLLLFKAIVREEGQTLLNQHASGFYCVICEKHFEGVSLQEHHNYYHSTL